MEKIDIQIISNSGKVPAYQTEGAAGFDLAAYLEEPIVLEPGKRALVPTGLFVAVPTGYEMQVRARSGLAIRQGIGLVNGIGTIDSDYRGEIKVPLINWGEEAVTIANGDRIAQGVIAPVVRAEFCVVSELEETDRGVGGFGHTGV